MKILFRVLRREAAGGTSEKKKPFWQGIPYETEDPGATVASALTEMSRQEELRDENGTVIPSVRWECSCLQKKCGACAMVINGRPRLACDTFLRDFRKKGLVTLEPLRKFPVVEDLITDRSIMRENLKEMRLWAESGVEMPEKRLQDVYDASRCLQCGCCLEVCPQFAPGDPFFGAAAFVPASRLLLSRTEGQREKGKEYKTHIYNGCGKSLSCRDICPAGIDTERLLSASNALAVWRRRR